MVYIENITLFYTRYCYTHLKTYKKSENNIFAKH